MKYKSIKNMITEETWNKIKEEMAEDFAETSKRFEGNVVEKSDLELTLSCDFANYYQIPIANIAEVIEKQYPFIKKKKIEFQPLEDNYSNSSSSCYIAISDFEVETKQDLTDAQEEVVALIRKELIEIYDELDVEITAYTEDLTDEELEEHGEGYVRIVEIA